MTDIGNILRIPNLSGLLVGFELQPAPGNQATLLSSGNKDSCLAVGNK